MDRDEVIRRVQARRGRLEQLGVASLSLFGSVARGDARADSDVDLLVRFDGPATFDRFMDLKLFLEDVLQVRVDLVTEKAMRAQVEGELMRVAWYLDSRA
ncbi:MAG: nucleotidyltransferase family protein [Polyangiaceae bacterium]|nr:nucleotidyltransferase family protein [Polyangiaceae bacterium]